MEGGKTFAVPTGTVADQSVLKRFPGAELSYYNSVHDCALAVSNGQADAAVYDKPVLKNIAAKNPGMKVLDEVLFPDQYGFAVALDNLELKYSALGNRLLMRLVWQTFMFLHDPFFSVRESKQYFEQSADHLPTVLNHCRKKDWAGLRCTLDEPMKRLSSALEGFYASKITMHSPEKESAFVWSVYKKSQQLCYSFAMELLLSISMGTYPEGSLLPSQKELAGQRGVSL